MRSNHAWTRLFVALALIVLWSSVPSCSKDEDPRAKKARKLANDFHAAILNGDIKQMLELADYPFNFDGQGKFKDPESLKAMFEKHRSTMRQQIQPATNLEVATWDEFTSGREFNNTKLKKDEALKQASRVDFRDDGVIVRCYFVDSKSEKQDGRCYFLVIHPNLLGELKVTTYWD